MNVFNSRYSITKIGLFFSGLRDTKVAKNVYSTSTPGKPPPLALNSVTYPPTLCIC